MKPPECFPRWEISLPDSPSDASAAARSGSFCATVETSMRVSDTETPSSCSVRASTVSSSDFVVACGGATDCPCAHAAAASHCTAEDYVAMEFQNNWPPLESAQTGTDSESTVEDDLAVEFASRQLQRQSQHLEHRQKRLQSRRQASAAVSRGDASDSGAAAAAASFPAWRESSAPPSRRRRGVFLNNSSNNVTIVDKHATAADDGQGQPGDERKQSCCCCWQNSCTPLRVLILTVYYLVLWCVTAGFTYAILLLCLRATSTGPLPYYMGRHSFYLESPKIGFAGGNPEPGKVTELPTLAALRDALTAELPKLASGRELRTCDSLADTTVEAELMKPCNMTQFEAKAKEKLKSVLRHRPAAMIQIRRHLGYLPVSGPSVMITCTCTADGKNLALTYHSWNGTDMVEASNGGAVPSNYFPMLTASHHAPSVLVALDSAVSDTDWVGKQLKLQCEAADGGKKQPGRELLLVVKQVTAA